MSRMMQAALEIGVALKSLRGRKQDGFVGVMLEQPLDAPQHCGVVIDHQNEFSIWHLTIPDLSCRNNWGCAKGPKAAN